MEYFKSSFIISAIGLIVAAILGYNSGSETETQMITTLSFIYTVILLSLLEVSFSFDNAVKNAAVLKNMSKVWQDRFITWGIPIAVFGMRFLFPIIIVMIASGNNLIDTFTLALDDPEKYHQSLEGSKDYIYAFGGSFLLMVALEFFFDEDRDIYWIKLIENSKVMKKAITIPTIEITLAITLGLMLTFFKQDYEISIAYFTGILLYTLLTIVDDVFSTNGVKNGLMGLLYLEILDASFSFDGVIGAFALSTDIFIIMIGLGVGAMYVRSLTLLFVNKGTLEEFIYLEHGAHYAIATLALIMIIKMFVEIPEIIVGTIGIGFIILAFISSIIEKKCKEKKEIL